VVVPFKVTVAPESAAPSAVTMRPEIFFTRFPAAAVIQNKLRPIKKWKAEKFLKAREVKILRRHRVAPWTGNRLINLILALVNWVKAIRVRIDQRGRLTADVNPAVENE
jgi:hypothetical protein